jgi:DNA-binding transcriptional ArsR family regulator
MDQPVQFLSMYLAKPLAMSMPGVIQHIQVLERSGLVTSAKVGRTRICRIDTETLRAAERWFASRRADQAASPALS